MTLCPRFVPMSHLDPGVEVDREQLLEFEDPRGGGSLVLESVGATGSAELVAVPDRVLDRPDRKLLGHRPTGQGLLERPVRGTEQSPGMPRASSWPSATSLLDRRGQLKQAQGVGDGHPAAADPGRQLLVGQAEILDQLLVGTGLLERVEVLAMKVLDQGLLDAVRARGRCGRWPGSSATRPAWPPATVVRRRSARRRRRPAARTSTGWSTPTSRIDAVREARLSSSKEVRGWWGLARIAATGMSSSGGRPVPHDLGGDQGPQALYLTRCGAPPLTSLASSR